jgi:hypothetical protein
VKNYKKLKKSWIAQLESRDASAHGLVSSNATLFNLIFNQLSLLVSELTSIESNVSSVVNILIQKFEKQFSEYFRANFDFISTFFRTLLDRCQSYNMSLVNSANAALESKAVTAEPKISILGNSKEKSDEKLVESTLGDFQEIRVSFQDRDEIKNAIQAVNDSQTQRVTGKEDEINEKEEKERTTVINLFKTREADRNKLRTSEIERIKYREEMFWKKYKNSTLAENERGYDSRM